MRAVLGASAALGPPPLCRDTLEPPWRRSAVEQRQECGGKEAQADVGSAHRSLQGCGLHPVRDGHREAALPRLHGQGGAAPHLPTPRSVSCRSLHLTSRGRQHPVQHGHFLGPGDPSGRGSRWSQPLSAPTSSLTTPPAPNVALGPGLSPSQPLLISPGTPTEETWPGVMALSEFRAYNFPRYLPQPLLSHVPR